MSVCGTLNKKYTFSERGVDVVENQKEPMHSNPIKNRIK